MCMMNNRITNVKYIITLKSSYLQRADKFGIDIAEIEAVINQIPLQINDILKWFSENWKSIFKSVIEKETPTNLMDISRIPSTEKKDENIEIAFEKPLVSTLFYCKVIYFVIDEFFSFFSVCSNLSVAKTAKGISNNRK